MQQRGNFGDDQRQKAIVCFQKGVTVVHFRDDNLASGHSATPWTVAHKVPLSMGILQTRIPEWVSMPSSRGSSQPRDRTQVSCIEGRFFTIEPPGKSKETGLGSLSLLQGIFPIQELNQGLRHCRQILYQLSYQGSPNDNYQFLNIHFVPRPIPDILMLSVTHAFANTYWERRTFPSSLPPLSFPIFLFLPPSPSSFLLSSSPPFYSFFPSYFLLLSLLPSLLLPSFSLFSSTAETPKTLRSWVICSWSQLHHNWAVTWAQMCLIPKSIYSLLYSLEDIKL